MLKSTGARFTSAALVCTALAAAAMAAPPTIGPQKRIDVNGQTASASETTGAGSHDFPSVVVAAWNDWRQSPPPPAGEVIRMGVALSANGGLSWDDFLIRPPGPFQSSVEGDPMTAADPRTGAVWVGAISFAGNGGLYVARKDLADDDFQPSVMADTGSGIDKCWMVAGRNEITPDSTRVYIAYNFGLVRSDNLGDNWTNPVSLGSGLGFLPRIGPDGQLYVAYWNFGNEKHEIKRSLNGGTSFVTRTIAARMDTWGVETSNPRFPGTFRVAPIPSLAVDPNDGTLYAVWPDTTDQAGGQANVDVYFSRSLDQGDTWSTPVVLNSEGPNVGDQFFPWIEVDAASRVHVLFLDSRNTAQPDSAVNGFFDAYYAYSLNHGTSWTEARLTPSAWNSNNDGLNRPEQFIGDYLGMAVAGDRVWPIYLDTSSGDPNIYTNEISFACPTPPEVPGLKVSISPDGTQLTFKWTNAGTVFNYGVFEDVAPNGSFATLTGTGFSGTLGITVPTPSGDRYYRVAGKNACGFGPK